MWYNANVEWEDIPKKSILLLCSVTLIVGTSVVPHIEKQELKRPTQEPSFIKIVSNPEYPAVSPDTVSAASSSSVTYSVTFVSSTAGFPHLMT
jgi:malic enzyme